MLTFPVKLVFQANLLFSAQNASLRRSTADFQLYGSCIFLSLQKSAAFHYAGAFTSGQ
jgi:hypothetical protein